MLLRGIRDVVGGIRRRIVVLVSIDPEYREISRVARPHPVVRVSSELAYRRRRCSDETDILECLVKDKIPYVFIVERYYVCFAMRVFLFCLLAQLPFFLLKCVMYDEVHVTVRILVCLSCLLFGLEQFVGHIFHAFEKCYRQAFHRKLFSAVHCPVSVLKIVMLDRTQFLDTCVAAVVVCQQQAFVGDDFPGTASSELHYRILDGRMVDIVNLFCRKAASGLSHCFDIHPVDEGKQPHSFVRFGWHCRSHGNCENQIFNLFHFIWISLNFPARIRARAQR